MSEKEKPPGVDEMHTERGTENEIRDALEKLKQAERALLPTAPVAEMPPYGSETNATHYVAARSDALPPEPEVVRLSHMLDNAFVRKADYDALRALLKAERERAEQFDALCDEMAKIAVIVGRSETDGRDVDWFELSDDVQRALQDARRDLDAYLARFQHRHVNAQDGTDACKECGFDLRNPIHSHAGKEKA